MGKKEKINEKGVPFGAQTAAFNAYKQNSMPTDSPGQLTLMLYNGCLKFLMKAKKAIDGKKIEEKKYNIWHR